MSAPPALPARVGVVGPGRMGRQMALAAAAAGCPVVLADLKPRPRSGAALEDARREIARDLALMAEEGLIAGAEVPAVLARIEGATDLAALGGCDLVEEALPERLDLKRETLARLGGVLEPGAIVASTSSTITPSDMADALSRPERFLVAHWLNPAHVIPLVEVVPGPATSPAVAERLMAWLAALGKTPVRCAPSPGFIGPRLQVLLMNEAVRLVEEGVATAEDVDRAFRAGLGFRYATVGIFEFIDWGGVDILHRASEYMVKATGDDRFRPARLVEAKMAAGDLGPKTGRGFFDYAGGRREEFETARLRALLRQLRREREARA